MGDGMIDAACGAIQRAAGVEATPDHVQRLVGDGWDRRVGRRRRPARDRRAARDRPRRRHRRRGGERPRLPRRDQPRAASVTRRARSRRDGCGRHGVRPERVGAGMRPYRIGVIRETDRPEVVAEALKVLDAVREDVAVELVEFDLGADRYLRTGTLPDEELERCGSRRDPPRRGGRPARPARVLERDLLLRIRFELDQYVNLRPSSGSPACRRSCRPTEDDVNMVVVRRTRGPLQRRRRLPPQGDAHEVAVHPRSTRGTASSGSCGTRSSTRCAGPAASRSSTRRTC